jgi:hypothetical protein
VALAGARVTGPAVFVDESKAKAYLLVAAAILPDDAAACRQQTKALLLPGQPRLHMKKESDARRARILQTFATFNATVTIYVAPRRLGSEVQRRSLCLDRLVHDLGPAGGRLCLERDESLVRRDRQRLIESTRSVGSRQELTYWHESAASEPLLAVPDAVGWAWARGGDWKRHALKLVSGVVQVAA